MFALFQQFGDNLLETKPEEFNIISDGNQMSITHKGMVLIRGGIDMTAKPKPLEALKNVVESIVRRAQK